MSAGPTARSLSFATLLALGVNGIVGVGIFFAPSEVARRVPGSAGLYVYAVTALLLLPVALVYARLGGRFDEDGGPYVWARAAFGPQVAFGVGWIAYVSALFSTSAVVAGFAEHAAPSLGLTGAFGQRLFGLAAIASISLAVASGLRPSALVWSGVTVLKLIPLLLLVVLLIWGSSGLAPQRPERPLSEVGLNDFTRATLLVVFTLQGFEIVPLPAGNARRSRWAVPLATLGSLALAAGLYVALHLACVRAVPNLSESAAPLVDAARNLGGSRMAWLVGVGTNVSALGIAFGMFAMTPRYLLALGKRDGLGEWLGAEDRRHVPQRALWITVPVVAVFVVSGKLAELFALSSVAVLAQYGVSAAALGVLSLRRRAGLSRSSLWPAPLALLAIVLVAHAASAKELIVAGGVLLLGVLLYLFKPAQRGAG